MCSAGRVRPGKGTERGVVRAVEQVSRRPERVHAPSVLHVHGSRGVDGGGDGVLSFQGIALDSAKGDFHRGGVAIPSVEPACQPSRRQQLPREPRPVAKQCTSVLGMRSV